MGGISPPGILTGGVKTPPAPPWMKPCYNSLILFNYIRDPILIKNDTFPLTWPPHVLPYSLAIFFPISPNLYPSVSILSSFLLGASTSKNAQSNHFFFKGLDCLIFTLSDGKVKKKKLKFFFVKKKRRRKKKIQ